MAGAEAVKAAGKKYLPSLNSQATADYNRYKERATFLGATGRTLAAFTGLLMRKTPDMETEAVTDIIGDIDARGSTLNDYIRAALREAGSTGRAGTLIDWTTEEGGRPYFSFYLAEDIVNWHVDRIDGRNELTLLVLRERGHRLNEDTFEHESIETFRIYRLREAGLEMETIVVVEGFATPESTDPVLIRRRGEALRFIPFVFHGLLGNVPECGPIPMLDLAEINLSHYRTSADLENGRHVAGLPTPWAFGVDIDQQVLTIGTTEAWTSSNEKASCGYMEFTGAGLSELRLAIIEKQEQMATLGARLLQQEKAAAEAYQTVRIRHDAEQSVLVNVAESTSASISIALQIAAWWMGAAAVPEDLAETTFLVLSTDFSATPIAPDQLAALVAGYQTGTISWPTLYYQLQQGELYPDGWTQEDEEAALSTARVLTPPVPTTVPDPVPEPAEDPVAA